MTDTRSANGWSTDDAIEGGRGEAVEGVVVELLPRAMYRVDIGPGDSILAHAVNGPRRSFVRILKGDRVTVFRATRNRTRGRIIARCAG